MKTGSVVCLLLAFGVFLGSWGFHIQEAYKPQNPEQFGRAPFLVISNSDQNWALAEAENLPTGSEFYLPPSELPNIVKSLSTDERSIKLDSAQHSRSRKEQVVTLEVSSGGAIDKYIYRAGVNDVVPTGRSRLDSSSLWYAAGKALGNCAWVLVLWLVMMALLRKKS